MEPGPVAMTIAITTGPGRNWTSLWKPLIDAFGPVLGEDPARPYHPRDDRIVSLGLHHHTDEGLGHDVIIDAWGAVPDHPATSPADRSADERGPSAWAGSAQRDPDLVER